MKQRLDVAMLIGDWSNRAKKPKRSSFPER